MRTLAISKNSTPPPLEAVGGLLQAFQAWRDRWRPKMEAFECFASGAGGWGVLNTEDEVELSRAMQESPAKCSAMLRRFPPSTVTLPWRTSPRSSNR